MESTDVYNNTIYNSKGSGVTFGVAQGVAEKEPIGRFYSNIFVTGEAQTEGPRIDQLSFGRISLKSERKPASGLPRNSL